MRIRPETPADYAAIAALHGRAFGCRTGEGLVVALHRQRAVFDPELSLVVEDGGRIAGHVLFSPHRLRLLEQDVRAVNLAPVAVEPASQRRGIGGALIDEGHAVAWAKGYAASFLLGHASYYPRFGYRTRAFGAPALTVPASVLTSAAALDPRSPRDKDLPALHAVWRREEGAVDFALDPGEALLDWLNPNPAIAATVYLRDGALVGYTRVHSAQPAAPRVFLAADAAAARAIAAFLSQQAGSSELVLPLHQALASAQVFGQPAGEPWEAAMALSLLPSPFDEYHAQLQAGRRPPGRPIWPVEFDLT